MGEHKNKNKISRPSQEQIEREVAAKYAMKRASLAEAFAISMCRNVAVVSGSAAPDEVAERSVALADALMERLYNRPVNSGE